MKTQQYDRHNDYRSNNVASTTVPLQINCAGIVANSRKFASNRPEGRNDYYLMYLYKGTIQVDCLSHTETMVAGQIVLFAPHTPLRYGQTTDEEMVYYWMHFTGSQADALLRQCGLEPLVLYTVGVREETIQAFQTLFEECITNDAFSDGLCAAQGSRILLEMARQTVQQPAPAGRFWQSIEYMHHHFAAPIRLQELAQRENLSESRYRAAFRAHTGQSPWGYLTNLRMRNACALLMQTDLSMQQIAEACGYTDAFYFSRLFHKCIGVTPSAYRNGQSDGGQ